MLLPGEQELADKLLELTKTERDADATFSEQATILRQMSELYLKDAIETGNGEQFVKASALINAALVRTEDESEHYPLHEILCNIYMNFMKNIASDTSEFTVDTLVDRTNSNQDFLHRIRVEIDEICEKLKFYYYSDPNVVYGKNVDLLKVDKEITQEAEKVSSRVQTRMLEFIKRLWGQATELLSVSPPCEYAVIGLGSLARQETTPFSDIEFAMLVESNTEENNQYFKNLVHLFHLLVLDLGETPIPDVAIESLNDFMSPGGDKYFDGITPRGFRFDGAMPWACKTPIGRKQTPLKEPLDLIKTPEEMAALLQENNVLCQSYHVSTILCNPILIYGDFELFEKYTTLKKNIIRLNTYKEMARKSLIEDYERSPDWNLLRMVCDHIMHSKTVFYRYSSTFVENLRMYFTPDNQANSNWKVLDHLFETQILSELGAFNLKAQLSISYGLRLLTYLQNRGQYESFDFFCVKKRTFDKDRKKETVKQRSRSRLAKIRNGKIIDRLSQGSSKLRHITESYFMEKSKNHIHNLSAEDFFPENETLQEKTGTRNRFIFGNLRWARSSRELPFNGCGQSCGVDKLCQFSHIPMDDYSAMLKALDEILDIKGCKCLSLLRTNLLVSKDILIKENTVASGPGAADARKLLTSYQQKQYRNVRERFYLLLDICDLAKLTLDESEIRRITDEIEFFLDDIRTFEEAQQKTVDVMKTDLISVLIVLYRISEQNDKGVQLCQKEINKEDREHGLDGNKLRGGRNYEAMGDLISQCGRPLEALDYYNHALTMNLMYFENIGVFLPEADRRVFGKTLLRQNQNLVLKMGELYCRFSKIKDAIKVLKKVLTENGEIIDIETDVALVAMCRLCSYFSLIGTSEKNLREGNRYLEKILESIIERIPIPPVAATVAAMLHCWIIRLHAQANTSFIIEHVYKEYCKGKSEVKTKEQFLIEILCKLINNESTYTYFMERKGLNNIPPQCVPTTSLVREWDNYIFTLCEMIVEANLIVSRCFPFAPGREYRVVVLNQIEIFCKNVVKKIATKKIYKMCLVYISFQRAKIMFSYTYRDVREHDIETTIASGEKLYRELLHFFPNCRTAQKAILTIQTFAKKLK